MKVLVDTNILIDQLCNRDGFAKAANQYFSAKLAGMDAIVTRDKKGFELEDIPCYDINDFLSQI